MQRYSAVTEAAALVANALHGLTVVGQRLYGPPLRNRAEVGVDEARGKEVREGLGEPGVTSLGLGADGSEVDEPVLEQRPRHRLQRLVHTPIQLDLVVQRTKDVSDGMLFK